MPDYRQLERKSKAEKDDRHRQDADDEVDLEEIQERIPDRHTEGRQGTGESSIGVAIGKRGVMCYGELFR